MSCFCLYLTLPRLVCLSENEILITITVYVSIYSIFSSHITRLLATLYDPSVITYYRQHGGNAQAYVLRYGNHIDALPYCAKFQCGSAQVTHIVSLAPNFPWDELQTFHKTLDLIQLKH